jgi:hypothetical protein
VLAFMAGRRDWRGLAGAAAGAATVVIAGLVTAGPNAMGAFVSALLQPANSPTAQMQGASGIFGSLLGGGLVPFGLSMVLSLGAVVVAAWTGAVSRRRADLLEPALLAAVALSLFASPHLLGHDLTLLAPAVAAALLWGVQHEEQSSAGWPGRYTLTVLGAWAAVNVSSMLDLGKNSVGVPGRLTPWVLLAAILLLLSPLRLSRDAHSGRRVASAASAQLAARY